MATKASKHRINHGLFPERGEKRIEAILNGYWFSGCFEIPSRILASREKLHIGREARAEVHEQFDYLETIRSSWIWSFEFAKCLNFDKSSWMMPVTLYESSNHISSCFTSYGERQI